MPVLGYPFMCFCHAGNTFVPLGGQHISYAIYLLYKQRQKAGVREEDIPENLRFLVAEVLSHKTPLSICQAACGHHQRTQHNVRAVRCVDALRHLRAAAAIKQGHTGAPYLTDEEIFIALKSLGIRPDDQAPSTSPTKGKAKAQAEDPKTQVCQFHGFPGLILSTSTEKEPHQQLEAGGLVRQLLVEHARGGGEGG